MHGRPAAGGCRRGGADAVVRSREPPAHAIASCSGNQTYQVDTTSDENDGNATDPAGPDGKLSLREAIDNGAGQHAGQSTIDLPAGHYTLTSTLAIAPGCGLTIQGGGARSTVIDGAGSHLVLANSDTATIDGVTITGGHNPTGGGGGVSTDGNLTLTDDAIVGNSAEFGGGVANTTGTLTVSGSSFANNSAGGGTSGAQGGGAIYNNGTATITNSTISDNSDGANKASGGAGGGIYADNSATTTLNFDTLDGNRAAGTGASGGDVGGPAEVFKGSTIFAGGSPSGCSRATSSSSSGDVSISDDRISSTGLKPSSMPSLPTSGSRTRRPLWRSPKDRHWQTRTDLLSASLKMNPIRGAGPQSLGLALDAHNDPEIGALGCRLVRRIEVEPQRRLLFHPSLPCVTPFPRSQMSRRRRSPERAFAQHNGPIGRNRHRHDSSPLVASVPRLAPTCLRVPT